MSEHFPILVPGAAAAGMQIEKIMVLRSKGL